MINVKKDTIKYIKSLYNDTRIEESATNIRGKFSDSDGKFSVFDMFSLLDSMVILHDDEDVSRTRFVTFRNSDSANYLILNTNRSVEEMRFDAACMLKKLLKEVGKMGDKVSLNCTVADKAFSREEKHFACALLMPKKALVRIILQKDENGNYKYLNKKGELSLKNVNVIADYFGVPFNKCLSRIYYVLDDLNSERKDKLYIEGCYNRSLYKEVKSKYSEEQMLLDRKEVCPNYEKNNAQRVKHLIDSLHYRSYSKLSEVAKRRLLVNLAKFDSINEGVVKSEKEAKKIINDFIACEGEVKQGKLVTKDAVYDLSNEQLVVLGEYTLYKSALSRGLIKGIAKSDPSLSYIANLSYEEALNELNERDIARYICDLHRRMFGFISEKYNETRGGFYRNYPVKLSGTTVSPMDPYLIKNGMENLSWRILDILKRNARGEYSNSEYLTKVNECIYEMIRMQPFGDGNKRTSRLLSNLLYQEKGIPFVLLPPSTWDEYVDAWSSDNTDKYNNLMNRLILDSYSYFYGDQSVSEAVITKNQTEKIINANIVKKK